MRRFAELRAEFAAIFQKRMMLIALIAIMFVPFLYAGVYLYAFKDPYGELDHLPVAVVNLDKGATHDGKALTVGKDFVKKLKEKATFQWHFVTNKEAQEGLKNQKYYMVIRIPENFSKNATTLMDDHPKHLELEYIPNKAYNFLASQISSSAVEKMKEEVSATITETYAEDMFNSVAKVSDGLKEASDGAGKLRDGSQTLTDKLNEVSSGAPKLYDGSQTITGKLGELNAGASKLYSGSQELSGKLGEVSAGAPKLYDGSQMITKKLGELSGGAAKLYEGSQQLAGKLDEISQGVPKLYEGSQQVSKGASDLATGLPQWKSSAEQVSNGAQTTAKEAKQVESGLEELNTKLDTLPEPYKSQMKEAVQALIKGNKQVVGGAEQVAGGTSLLAKKAGDISDGANKLAAGSSQLTEKLGELKTGAPLLAAGANQLKDGLNQVSVGSSQLAVGSGQLTEKLGELNAGALLLANGANQIADGLSQLTSGSNQLAAGSSQLTEKLGELKTGAPQLADGSKQILDGQNELTTKLGDAAKETGDVKGSDEKYNMFAKPVEVTTHSFGEVDNYGTGVSPYFISLGLYVGALLLSVIYPLREAAGIPKNGFRWFASKYTVLLIVGVMQSLIIDAVVLFGLDFKVQSEPRFVLFTLITSIAFLSLIQFLVTTFGDVGRFAAIIILILQLTTSAGTYPIEMVNKAMQAFGPLVPMTYSVAGFKAVITSGDYSFMWHNAGVLAMWALGCILCTNIYFQLLHRRCFKKVQPGTDAGAQA